MNTIFVRVWRSSSAEHWFPCLINRRFGQTKQGSMGNVHMPGTHGTVLRDTTLEGPRAGEGLHAVKPAQMSAVAHARNDSQWQALLSSNQTKLALARWVKETLSWWLLSLNRWVVTLNSIKVNLKLWYLAAFGYIVCAFEHYMKTHFYWGDCLSPVLTSSITNRIEQQCVGPIFIPYLNLQSISHDIYASC